VLLSSLLTKSIQKELNSFFSRLSDKDYNILTVTKGALSQARAKLKPEAFIELSQLSVSRFYEYEKYSRWKGFRVLAVDGSTSNLPTHSSVKKDFGSVQTGCKGSVESSMARISLFYDVLNCITLDACIDSQSISESGLLKRHLVSGQLRAGDILLTDRGYSSNALMYELHQSGVDFCMRMRSHWHQVQDFSDSDEQGRIVKFSLPRKDIHLQKKYQSNINHVTCRLVSVILPTGEKEILCTSLLNEKEYTAEDIAELYHLRWNIEEAYKLLKVRMQLSNYSGKTSHSVRQDFYAKIFMMNMCAIMSFPVVEKIRKENQTRKNQHPHQLNKTNIVFTLKEAWVALWLKKKTKQLLLAFDNILIKTKEIVRPNRTFERKKYRYPDKKPAPPYKKF
jgi:hypothetical protein